MNTKQERQLLLLRYYKTTLQATPTIRAFKGICQKTAHAPDFPCYGAGFCIQQTLSDTPSDRRLNKLQNVFRLEKVIMVQRISSMAQGSQVFPANRYQ
ncbi:hypothetical protein AVEN_27912-1 [Araneus ventricosus]|uniref:Uncharacterized protein n=1 Tax=Araneus ventricosus TaxID=182803 RepID=A0A4Y2HLI3_ARAVE|nr:hypothetical protein AVEN_27912-1 [Araneus ventricosus]